MGQPTPPTEAEREGIYQGKLQGKTVSKSLRNLIARSMSSTSGGNASAPMACRGCAPGNMGRSLAFGQPIQALEKRSAERGIG